MKTIITLTHLITAASFFVIGAHYKGPDNTRREIFAAGAVAGINISTIDNVLRRQGVTLTETEIKKLINNEWLKHK